MVLGDLHAISGAKLVFRDDECNQRPECTGQEGVGQTHQHHGQVRNEYSLPKEGKHGMGHEGQNGAKVYWKEKKEGDMTERERERERERSTHTT